MTGKLTKLLHVPRDIWLMFITYLPGPAGMRLRYRYWKRRLKYLGDRVLIHPGAFFSDPDYICIDDNSSIDRNVIILAGPSEQARETVTIRNREYKGEPGVVHIGKNIHVAPGCLISGVSAGVYVSDDCGFSASCKVYAFSHHYRSRKDPSDANSHFGPRVEPERQCMVVGPVFLGRNTGVAANAVILPGASMGENSFVAVNSVVPGRRFPANSMIAGAPAKRVGDRFETKK